jgi:hypothetical protein
MLTISIDAEVSEFQTKNENMIDENKALGVLEYIQEEHHGLQPWWFMSGR